MRAIIAFTALLCMQGCAGGIIDRHFDLREREIEYRHKERMRELDLRERRCTNKDDNE